MRAYRRSAALGPVARLVTHRRRAVLCGRLGRAAARDRRRRGLGDGRPAAGGPLPGGRGRGRRRRRRPHLLHAAVARLEEAGAVAGDARPKLVRAIGFRARRARRRRSRVPSSGPQPMGEVIRAAIAQGYLRLLGPRPRRAPRRGPRGRAPGPGGDPAAAIGPAHLPGVPARGLGPGDPGRAGLGRRGPGSGPGRRRPASNACSARSTPSTVVTPAPAAALLGQLVAERDRGPRRT